MKFKHLVPLILGVVLAFFMPFEKPAIPVKAKKRGRPAPALRVGGDWSNPTVLKEHLAIAKHWTAERAVQEFVPGERGLVSRWQVVSRSNHWLDCLYLACAAGHYVGARLPGDGTPKAVIDAEQEEIDLEEYYANQGQLS